MGTLNKSKRLVDSFFSYVSVDGGGCSLRHKSSPDGRYKLVWDGLGHGYINGVKREKVPYYLAEDGFVIAEGMMEQPKNGVVANNGCFAFSNVPVFDGGKSEFLVFDKSGKCLYRQAVSVASINVCGIATEGHLAIYQTLYSHNPDDSCVTVLVDTLQGEELWRKNLLGNDGFVFYSDRFACLSRDYAYYYTIKDGTLLNMDDWLAGDVGNASGYAVGVAAEQQAISQELNRAILLMTHALKCSDVQTPESQARILRRIGEWHEELADVVSALSYYEKALVLDVKVGVKKKAVAMRKKLDLGKVQ